MIFRAKGGGFLRWLAIASLAIGVATAIVGNFVGLWLVVGGAAIALPGLFLLVLLGRVRDTGRAMDAFNRGLTKARSGEEKRAPDA
jgi:hypothetical protein